MNCILLDPSLRCFGVVVINSVSGDVVFMDTIQTNPIEGLSEGQSTIYRIRTIFEKLTNIIKEYKPSKAIFENPQGSQSSKALLALATVRSICVSIEFIFGIPVEHIEARDVKKLLNIPKTARKDTEVKEEVFKKVLEHYPKFETTLSEFKVKSKQIRYTYSDCLGVYLAYSIKNQHVK